MLIKIIVITARAVGLTRAVDKIFTPLTDFIRRNLMLMLHLMSI
jgi:hypothetical protein